MAIKPIPTRYKGYRFRSRLEARWAVFFDALGLAWEYEPEGFELKSGKYLPDFKVYYPGGDSETWFECKSSLDSLSPNDMERLLEFEEAKNLIILDGTPDCRMYVTPSAYRDHPDWYTKQKRFGAALWHPMKERIWWDEYENFFGCKDYYWAARIITRAVEAARSARFEHGETP